MFLQKFWIIFIASCLMSVILVNAGLLTPREMELRGAQLGPKKRPFCNAFTGCGKKRSEDSSGGLPSRSAGQQELEMENTLGDLIDLNAEPAVEELMRQIMSQAKLWEAIQEASREISSQKNANNPDFQNRIPLSFSQQ